MSIRGKGAIIAVGLAALTFAGCGGNTSASSTTTSSTVAVADEATTNLAKSAVYSQADLGDAWVVDTPAKEYEQVPGPACLSDLDKIIGAVPAGARQRGPQLHYKDTKWYVLTTAFVFPTEEAAKQYVDKRKSADIIECSRVVLEDEQKKGDPTLRVTTRDTTAAGVGTNGYEMYTRYQVQQDLGKGATDINGTFDRNIYRFGKVVLVERVEMLVSTTDPKDLNEKVSADLNRALQAVFARVPK